MPQKKILQERLLSRLGYSFNDLKLFKQALTHRSASSNHNERLEFLGDAILGMIIAEYLFIKFPHANEGEMSRLRSMLVKGKTLAVIAQEIELGECLYLGEGELKSGGYRRGSILADGFEALLGAIYMDSDFATIKALILSIYKKRLAELSLSMVAKDPKTRLQELLQSYKLELPDYDLIKVTGEAHEQTFAVDCKVPAKSLETHGSGTSRRNAEQLAAEKMLELVTPLLKAKSKNKRKG